MNQTIVEKVLARCSDQPDARAGDYVMGRPDLVMLHETGAAGVQRPLRELCGGRVHESIRAVMLSDHFVPAPTVQQAENQKVTRRFADEIGATYYEIGRGGIAHQVMVEEGHVKPGNLVIATDAHATMYGAAGAVGLGVGVTDMAVTLAFGALWLMVPPTRKIVIQGAFPPGVTAKDAALALMGRYGGDGLNYKAVEVDASSVRTWCLSDSLCVSNLLSEAGAKAVTFTGGEGFPQADDGAEYEAVDKLDLTTVEPLVALPHHPSNVKPVRDVSGKKVDQVFIGSCTNGRIDDLRAAAEILARRSIAPRVRVIVTPASRRIYLQALREGLIEQFVEAGVVVTTPNCGACVGGHGGLLAAGEVCVATSNRNFRGRMGSSESEIHLVSPLTAMAAAVTGEICDPRDLE